MKDQIENMLKKEVIRESSSAWSAPAILVPKKTTDGKPKYRFCVDFRSLNAVTKFDPYPLPVFEETTSTLFGSRYFSVLDCYSGFWQVPIKEEHKERTGFTVPQGHYEFNRLPFGLSNSPSNFQRLMDIVLRNLVGTECWVFIDDVIVYSKSAEEQRTYWHMILTTTVGIIAVLAVLCYSLRSIIHRHIVCRHSTKTPVEPSTVTPNPLQITPEPSQRTHLPKCDKPQQDVSFAHYSLTPTE